jgi:predicted MPP superfamily phosphohydrolase
MGLFFMAFFLLYGGLHLYVFLKAWQAFRFQWGVGSFIGLIFVVMIVSPVVVRFLERGGHEVAARFMAYSGYCWLGFMFFFFTISISFDILRFLAYIAGSVSKIDFSSFISAYRFFFLVTLAGSVLLVCYSYREAGNIRIETLRIETNKIPKEAGKITIAQISDVHLGLIVGEEQLGKILELVKKANPDIIVATGDFVDGDIDTLNGLVDMLKSVGPRYGKYAVTGNHEFYAGIETSLDFIRKSGFTMLRDEGLTAHGVINIAGVDDPAGEYFQFKNIPEKIFLSHLPHDLFTVLLKHRPVVDKDALGLFDLQLSGHTHKGQIYPFRYLTRLAFPLYTGYHKLPNNAHLYVSRGSGTWGPPIRFLTPPEVTFIELVPGPVSAEGK